MAYIGKKVNVTALVSPLSTSYEAEAPAVFEYDDNLFLESETLGRQIQGWMAASASGMSEDY